MTDTRLTTPISLPASKEGGLSATLRTFFSSMRRTALFYLAALTLAETLTALIEPRVGVAMHGLILIALLLQASLVTRGSDRRFLLCLTLAPLIRILSLSLPLPTFPFVYWYLIVGLPLFLAAYVAARIGRMNRGMIGLTIRHLPTQLLVAITGVGLGYVEYSILRPDPLASGLSWQQILVPALILIIFTGFLEELIFRGMMQYSSLRSLGRFGLWYVALVFTVLHLGYRSVLDLLFVFGVAMYFAWVTMRTGSILGVTLAHGMINVGLFLIFPFILAAPVTTPGVPGPVQPIQEPPGLLAPLPTAQVTRPWLPPAITPSPSPTPTATPCQPPQGWVLYTVRDGDSLVSLSQILNTPPQDLQAGNCLESDLLIRGQTLYLPAIPNTATPFSPPSQTPSPTRTQAPAIVPRNQDVTPVPTRTRRPTRTPDTSINTAVPPTYTRVPPTSTTIPPTTIPPTPTSAPPTQPPTQPPEPPPIEPTPTSAPPPPTIEPTPTSPS